MDFGNILPTLIENFTRLAPVRIVHSYEQGVKFRLGEDIKLLKTGMHFFVPFIESIEIDSTATRYIITPLQDLVTKDSQMISTSGSLSYCVKDFRKHWVRLQDREDSLMNLTQRAMAQTVPRYNYEQIKNSRIVLEGEHRENDFNSEVYDGISREVKKYGIDLESFGLVTFTKARQFRIISGNYSFEQIHNK